VREQKHVKCIMALLAESTQMYNRILLW